MIHRCLKLCMRVSHTSGRERPVPVFAPFPRDARHLAHGLQHRAPPLPPQLADPSRVRRNLRPATGPDAAQSAKLRASPRCPTRRNRQNSNSESRSRWIKVGGNVRSSERLAQGCYTLRPLPEGVPFRHRLRRNRHVLAMIQERILTLKIIFKLNNAAGYCFY